MPREKHQFIPLMFSPKKGSGLPYFMLINSQTFEGSSCMLQGVITRASHPASCVNNHTTIVHWNQNFTFFVHVLIVPLQPLVTSLWKIGQPCCRSKINRPHRGKIENLYFFSKQGYFLMLNQTCLFWNTFMHTGKSLQLSWYNDAEVFRKKGVSFFPQFVCLIFDLQDGDTNSKGK